MPEIRRKNRFFGVFSRFYHRFFLIFCTKMGINHAQNMTEAYFWENFFSAENAGNMPKIAVFADFVRVFSSYFVTFSHRNIIISNTHHQACFNCQKTDFWSRNCLKIAGKTVFLEYLELYLIFFSWNLAQRCKMAMPKMWRSPIFKKNFFRPKMPEICRKNRFFGIFSRFYH